MEKFHADVVLEKEEICNLQKDLHKLHQAFKHGDHLVFMGRRNTGKTSLVLGKLIPEVRRLSKQCLIIFVDFMGVKSIEQIHQRMTHALAQGYSEVRPTEQFLKGLMRTFKNIRPTFQVDPFSSSTSFSFGLDQSINSLSLEEVTKQIALYHREKSAFLIMDEFQDIALVEEGEALMRQSLQKLPANLPVLILGSKKHLLARIFAEHRAPLANWGRQQEISPITAEDYLPYMNERFKSRGKKIDLPLVQYLLEAMQFIPEPVNILCEWMLRSSSTGRQLSTQDIHAALAGVTFERKSLYREYLGRLTEKEEVFLTELAKTQPQKKLTGKDFLRRVHMSPGGVGPLIQRLLDQAVIYEDEKGYFLSDPLLAEFLRRESRI